MFSPGGHGYIDIKYTIKILGKFGVVSKDNTFKKRSLFCLIFARLWTYFLEKV